MSVRAIVLALVRLAVMGGSPKDGVMARAKSRGVDGSNTSPEDLAEEVNSEVAGHSLLAEEDVPLVARAIGRIRSRLLPFLVAVVRVLFVGDTTGVNVGSASTVMR